ncbi:unnamed protein product [Mytilus coruscus]|uniref:Uncharacterized protein n=1 Tax=Mytilus coruscus TaxID=42192 RepID=A0A6J8CBJ4_MYTCO|nr:unnamed protein product [Mytilus coruscus]
MADSQKRLRTHTDKGAEMYETARDDAKIKKPTKSHSTTRSSSSKRTVRSRSSFDSISSEVLKLKAKAAAARVCMEFAQKETELQKQNTLLEEEQKLANAKTNASLERKNCFVELIRDVTHVRNDPSFLYETTSENSSSKPFSKNFGSCDNWNKHGISDKKTEFKPNNDSKASQENFILYTKLTTVLTTAELSD